MPWLDGVASVLAKIGDPIVGQSAPKALKDALVGTWFGHPLHPAVVQAPLGFWMSSLALDLLDQDEAADATLALGLATAGAAALTGIAQWQDLQNHEAGRRLGSLHASVNSLATVVYGASLWQRRQDNRDAGLTLSMIGLGLVSFSSWLGGDLSYDLGIGVNHTAFEKEPEDWVDVAAETDLQEGKPKRVSAEDYPVMLLKRGLQIQAIAATCPHLSAPLDEGDIDGDTVICPWHGSTFCLDDGSLIHGPATAPVTSFDVMVEGGRVFVKARKAA
jgi:nitrite reductase/ring-hydroxylating ferredoxin subunit/uncharacterized membrane protein